MPFFKNIETNATLAKNTQIDTLQYASSISTYEIQ